MIDVMIKICLIDFIENFYLLAFSLLFVGYRKNIFNMKNSTVALGISVMTFVLNRQYNGMIFFIDRLILLIIFAFCMFVFYEHEIIISKHIFLGFLYGFVTMVFFEVLVGIPIVLYLGGDVATIQSNILLTVVASIPTRILEYTFLITFYKRKMRLYK